MKKSSKRLIVLFVISLVVLSYTGTALAAGETIYHYGTSRYSYTTNQSVPQKNDNHLYCDFGYKSNDFVRAMAVSSGDVVSTTQPPFVTSINLYIPDFAYVRDVAIRIENYDSGRGVSIFTEGWWTLKI